jgi:hypothetical protein
VGIPRVRSTALKNYMRNYFHMLQDCTSRVYGSRLGRVRAVIGLACAGGGRVTWKMASFLAGNTG